MRKELLIHDIRSVYNVGAMFRTADAVGIDKIYLSGYSPTPIDRFGRARQDFHKSALDSENSVEWEYSEDVFDLCKRKKAEGYKIVALEQNSNSIDYKKYKPSEKTLLVMGTESGGMDSKLLALCDVILEIPMRGIKDSLNVSVATGIILYRLFD